jgi:hypothetical protein
MPSLQSFLPRPTILSIVPSAFLLAAVAVLSSSCGGSASTTTSTGGTTTTNAYAAAYKNVTWASGVTVAFPSSCEMTVTSSGVPPSHNAYYLTPVANGQTVVATTASGIQLGVSPYTGSGISSVKTVSGTFNICPAKATSTTATGMGGIGVITSGEVLFDAYEATGVVAQGDNASYTFTSSGTSYTAYFIDQCNSHAAGGTGGSTWHYHGNPVCWTPTIDGSSNGPSHIIGIALDGFPIYGGRDINGNVIDPATLDACNGITSVTPEFSTATYHYVLPLNTTTKQSSINCYAGTPNSTLSAMMQKMVCNMPGMQMAHNMPMMFVPKADKPKQVATLPKSPMKMSHGM